MRSGSGVARSTAPVVEARSLAKTYRIYRRASDRWLERLPRSPPRHRAVEALRGVDFRVPVGTSLGVIGVNGSGKSTLLKILSGTTSPSAGSVTVRGRVASLLELGRHLDRRQTGRQNLRLDAAMQGLRRRAAARWVETVIDFSELRAVADTEVRTWSAGMVARLAFSAAVAGDPDVLILDEVFAVGDAGFQRRCVHRIHELKARGATLVLATHMVYFVQQLCERALWLRAGLVLGDGPARDVISEFDVVEGARRDPRTVTPWMDTDVPVPVRDDAGAARVESVTVHDPRSGLRRRRFRRDEPITISVRVRSRSDACPLSVAVAVIRSDGTVCFALSSGRDGTLVRARRALLELRLPATDLLSGEFTVRVWLLDAGDRRIFDDRLADHTIVVEGRAGGLGLFDHAREWRVEPCARASR